MGPLHALSDDATNGRVARELPVASALLIRRDLAQIGAIRHRFHFDPIERWRYCVGVNPVARLNDV